MAQWLRTLTTLAENLTFVPNIHVAAHNHLFHSVLKSCITQMNTARQTLIHLNLMYTSYLHFKISLTCQALNHSVLHAPLMEL